MTKTYKHRPILQNPYTYRVKSPESPYFLKSLDVINNILDDFCM